jgi:hypothetical protein
MGTKYQFHSSHRIVYLQAPGQGHAGGLIMLHEVTNAQNCREVDLLLPSVGQGVGAATLTIVVVGGTFLSSASASN